MTTSKESVASRAVRAGGSVVRGVRSAVSPSGSRPAGGGAPASGWLAVTLVCEPSDVDPAHLPAPLAHYGDRIEVRVRQAAGGKGTELAARLRDAQKGSAPARLGGADPLAGLRSALRQTKQLLEVGEVLRVDPIPHGERTASPGGALLEAATKAAPRAGVR